MEVRDLGLYIAGKSVPASSNETADVLDPATNRPFARVASGSRDDVNAAVEAARVAFDSPDWRDLGPSKRGRLLWVPRPQVGRHFRETSPAAAAKFRQPAGGGQGQHPAGLQVFAEYSRVAD